MKVQGGLEGQMMEYKPGNLAKSLAGRDAGRLYLILEEAGEYVALVDGKTREVSRPKRKKKKHVQLQYPKNQKTVLKLKQGEALTDEEIRSFLKEEGFLN